MSLSNSNSINAMEVGRILTIATQLYFDEKNVYSNIMMAIPNACNEWATEYRIYHSQFGDTEEQMQEEIDRVKRLVSNAFQFPFGFIKF